MLHGFLSFILEFLWEPKTNLYSVWLLPFVSTSRLFSLQGPVLMQAGHHAAKPKIWERSVVVRRSRWVTMLMGLSLLHHLLQPRPTNQNSLKSSSVTHWRTALPTALRWAGWEVNFVFWLTRMIAAVLGLHYIVCIQIDSNVAFS